MSIGSNLDRGINFGADLDQDCLQRLSADDKSRR